MAKNPTSPEPVIERLPSAKTVRARLSALLREAATLRRLLRVVEQAEKQHREVAREN